MHLKFSSMFAALLLVAACSTTPEESVEGSATGAQTEDQTAAVTASESDARTLETKIQDDSLLSVGDRIFFELDRSDLSSEAQETLHELAEWLNDRPSVSLTLEGHADERGTREYNLALGARRANAARDYLVALGIESDRLSTVSYGKERPAVLGSNEMSWSQNRRSVFVVN